jgi:hypothetical protein
MEPADFEQMKQDEIKLMLEYMDEVPDAYVNFLIWQQIKAAYRTAEENYSETQDTIANLDGKAIA